MSEILSADKKLVLIDKLKAQGIELSSLSPLEMLRLFGSPIDGDAVQQQLVEDQWNDSWSREELMSL